MSTSTLVSSDIEGSELPPGDIVPVSVLARLMLGSLGLSVSLIVLNFFLIIYSQDLGYLITLAMLLVNALTCIAGWRISLEGRPWPAIKLAVIPAGFTALAGIWMHGAFLPIVLLSLANGIILALPYASRNAFRRILLLSLTIVVLVGIIYIVNQTFSPLPVYIHAGIYITSLFFLIQISNLLKLSNLWMHKTVRETRAMNVSLQVSQADLEETIQRRTSELTQSNEHLKHEIAERRRVEVQLREQNNYLEALHGTSLGIIQRKDMHELLQYILDQAAALLQVEDAFLYRIHPEDSMARSFATLGLFSEDKQIEIAKNEGVVGLVWETGKTVAVDDYPQWKHRLPFRRKDNFYAVIGVPLFVDNKVFGVIGMVRKTPGYGFAKEEVNLLERFAGLASLACDNAQLYEAAIANEQALEQRVEMRTHELTAALEENESLRIQAVKAAMIEERSRIARDLHDSVSQAIYGIALGMRTLQKMTVARNGTDEQMLKVIDYNLSLAGAAQIEMRALIFELRPESLEKEGVLVALRRQCDVMQERYGLRIDPQIMKEEPAIPIRMKEAVYRIAIEATHNVIKHANAKHITVRFDQTCDTLRLEIIDDGIGFDMNGVEPGRLGLKSMQERVAQFKGTLVMQSALNKGTKIHVEIPLPAE